jgi:hypothetical protein
LTDYGRIGNSACSVNWSCILGERGINVGDFEFRTFTVAGYDVFQSRSQVGSGNASTTTYLRLSIQRTLGPPDRPATQAVITFSGRPAGGSHKIGQIEKRPPPHAGEFELDVHLPVADFDHYWTILTHAPRPHLRCVITPLHGVDIEDFTLASAEFVEGQFP